MTPHKSVGGGGGGGHRITWNEHSWGYFIVMCYIMGGFPFFNHARVEQIHAFYIDETVLHGVWELFSIMRDVLPELFHYII